jgi:glycosyltransferase involved in cell wall biosynthesis
MANENLMGFQPPLTWPINFLPDGTLYRWLYQKNKTIVLQTIEQVIKKYQLKDFIFLNCFNPYYAGVLPENFGQRLNIYQCIDDMTQEAYTARHGFRLEESAMREADVCLVTSTNLHSIKVPLNPNTYTLFNAANTDIFTKVQGPALPRPAEIAHVNTPVIGFTGNLDPNRIDYDLLRKIAEFHTDKTLVLVGPVSSHLFTEKGLDKIPNIISTGSKPIESLPAYLQYMDAVILPFQVNQLTASIYPLKINEYLAAGKPVVSTSFSNDIRSFSSVITLVDDHESFLQALNRAVLDKQEEQIKARMAVAASNSWASRVHRFWEIVDAHTQNTSPPPQIG